MFQKDQVARLRSLGINTCFYNTLITDDEKKFIINDLNRSDCQYEFLFLSPEGLMSQQMFSCLINLEQKDRINFFVIDEAHCIVTWGGHFRPDYAKLSVLKEKFDVPVIALTGTATSSSIITIKSSLGISGCPVVKLPSYRPNLYFFVLLKPESKVKEFIINYVSEHCADDCAIVYCGTQSRSTMLALDLKEHGISATYYHAGMEESEKVRNANAWFSGQFKVICCTSAFGMGVDKKDVRHVIHFSMPSSIEDYVQESGRAGRDGDSARCVLFYSFSDRSTHIQHLAEIENLVLRQEKFDNINVITKYCTMVTGCRQIFISNYFNNRLEKTCGLCDLCELTSVTQCSKVDFTTTTFKLLICLRNMILIHPYIKMSQLVSTFMGSKSKEIVDKKFNSCSGYGDGKPIFKFTTKASKFIEFLVIEDILRENCKQTRDNQFLVHLSCDTQKALNILNSSEKVFYSVPM